MREYIEKRAAGGVMFSRIGSNLSSRNPKLEDKSIQCCNRLGCSTRYYSLNGTQTGNSPNAKNPKASFHSLSSNSISGRSSKSPATSSKNSHQERRNRTSIQDFANAERSSRQGEGEDFESINRQRERVLPDAGDVESAVFHGFNKNITAALVNRGSGTMPRSRTQKEVNQQRETGTQNTSSSSIRHSIGSGNISQTNKYASEVAGEQRCGSKNVGCVPSGCSSSDSGRNRRVELARKRPSDGQSSSRGKSITTQNGGYLGSRLRGPSPSLSLPEHLISQQTSRKARNQPTSRNDTVLVRKPKALPTRKTSLRLSDAVLDCSTRSFPTRLPSICHSTSGRLGSSSRTARVRPTSESEYSNTGISHDPLGVGDGYRHNHMEGITEVLLALERIEQNEELTYEQLLVLEANFPFGGQAFDDQHRDMRLDIDNMSYEELLALEEKMGSVSTALTEEALSRCLKRSIYTPLSHVPGINGRGDDDTKCSICQEEYAIGDVVGKLSCEHRYHVACIHQWLGQKNWCPICKGSACSS